MERNSRRKHTKTKNVHLEGKWEILNEKLPEHQYESLEYCRDCNEIYLGKAHTIDICLSAVEI